MDNLRLFFSPVKVAGPFRNLMTPEWTSAYAGEKTTRTREMISYTHKGKGPWIKLLEVGWEWDPNHCAIPIFSKLGLTWWVGHI